MLENPIPAIQHLKHSGQLLYNGYALRRLIERELTTEQVETALDHNDSQVLRNYPQAGRPSPECLIVGQDSGGMYLHILVAYPVAEVITVYEPTPPKWKTPWERG